MHTTSAGWPGTTTHSPFDKQPNLTAKVIPILVLVEATQYMRSQVHEAGKVAPRRFFLLIILITFTMLMAAESYTP